MYFKDNGQISLFDFGQSAGLKLDPENRWVKMAHRVNWTVLEEKYSGLYSQKTGAPAKPIQLAIGAMLIQHMENLPDERLVLHIQENPYMQYFCGLKEYTQELPFVPSLMVAFRKRFGAEIIREINELLFGPAAELEEDDDDDEPDPDCPKHGISIMGATCAPANITYPQDVNLCNAAREKTEQMVEAMHERGNGEKPR